MCPADDSLSVSSDLSLSEYGSLKELERWRLQVQTLGSDPNTMALSVTLILILTLAPNPTRRDYRAAGTYYCAVTIARKP